MKKRHLFFWGLLRPLVSLFLRLKFGYQFKSPKALPPQYIVLSNHVTDWDPLFVAVALKKQMYFVGSEHIARWKRAYKLLKYVFAPIMRPKGASAMAAVMSILRHVKKGANVCLFPEGVRSWDGRPCPILPSTAKLVQKAGVGLVTFRITGGYFVSPMWSDGLRRGKISGAPVGIYSFAIWERTPTRRRQRILIPIKIKRLRKGSSIFFTTAPPAGKRAVCAPQVTAFPVTPAAIGGFLTSTAILRIRRESKASASLPTYRRRILQGLWRRAPSFP